MRSLILQTLILGTCFGVASAETPAPKPIDFAAYETSCTAGNAEGCADMGWAYTNGKGVKADPKKAFAAFTKSCDLGSMRGCNELSVAYETGQGVKKDAKRAVELNQKVCDSKDTAQRAFACGHFAKALYSGTGIKKDVAKSNEVYLQACDLGSMVSCSIIGAGYAFGEGVKKDVVKGKALLEKACTGGIKIACKQIQELAAKPKTGGGGGTCPGNAEIRCGGVCVSIWKPDSKNCGGCGNVCPSNHYCNQGTCTMR